MSAFPARHPGRCHNDCGTWIDRGDLIRMTDDGAVHDDCSDVRTTTPARCQCSASHGLKAHGMDPARCPVHDTLPPACPKCWLHHAGECDR